MPEDRDEKDSAEEADGADGEEQDDSESEDAASKTDASESEAAPEGDDSSDDEDEDEEPEPKPKKKKASDSRRAGGPQRKRRTAPVKAVLPPEKDIAAPSRQTLILLGAMAFATLAMWGSARFACNAHPAQTRKPREVTTAELSRDPKDAALELQQRWNGYDFKGALELAKGSIAEELKKAQADCEKDATCESKKKELDGKVLATAALLSRGMGTAKVRVISRGGAVGDKTIVYALEQEGSAWKVSGRTEAPAAPAPTPSAAPAPAPSGSAAP